MKNLGLFIVATFCLLVSLAFGIREKGSRNIKKKEIPISNYSAIEASGSADIYYEQKPNEKPYLCVEIDENLMRFVTVQVKNGILILGTKSNSNVNPSRFRIYTNSQSLAKAGLKGSGNLYLKGKIQSDRFEVYVKGSGDVSADALYARSVSATIQGSGNLTLKGRTDNLSATIAGSGDLNARLLTSRIADCKVQGSGDLLVNAREELSAEIRGSGDISYTGSPKRLNKSVRGSGSINQK